MLLSLSVSFSLFAQLTPLSIINSPSLPDHAAIFEHCTSIRALAFVDKAPYDGHAPEGVSHPH